MTDDFPRQHARTQRFTLGRPRSFTIAPDGDRVLFLRTRSGDDASHDLLEIVTSTGQERVVLEAGSLTTAGGDLTAAERARRERLREGGAGITSYATDRDVTAVVTAYGGVVWHLDLGTGRAQQLPFTGPAFDPRPSPEGGRVAAVVDGGLEVVNLDGPADREPLRVAEDGVSWGMAEFVAAEEMGRLRGHWWLPDGDTLLVARVDESAVPTWTIADPANPDAPPTTHRYPAAGTTNADVTLWRVGVDGARTEVVWDREAFEYLAAVVPGERPLVQVQSRDQRRTEVREVTGDGATVLLAAWEDEHWVELVPGTPAWAGDRLVTVRDDRDRDERVLVVDEEAVSPSGWQVREVLDATTDHVVVRASTGDPTMVAIARVDLGGAAEVLTEQDGVHAGVYRGDVGVVVSATMFQETPATGVRRDGRTIAQLTAVAERAGLVPTPRMLLLGPDELRAGLLLPRPEVDPGGSLPVLLDPYGGPHAQRVLASHGAWLTPQWFADQGYAVLVVDGRGTPGRGPTFERAVHGDLATGVLTDQVAALDAAAELEPRLALDRVGIRGWSFGGYLAALAVLRRPDRFHAAVVGAPVTDWALYDTHYTERYLGHPGEVPGHYEVSSLVDAGGDLLGAVEPPGPYPGMLLIHGLADDNVVAAHSLRLSRALLAAGRPHEFLPLSGVTHMTPQEDVAANLLAHQVDFFARHLA